MNSATDHRGTIRKPFIEHLHELRTRLVWSALALAVGGGISFALHEKLLALIQKPLGETLYYTSPTGGFNFAFKMSLTFGVVLALPVLVYHLLKFFTPLIGHVRKLYILTYLLWSLDLAYFGVLFAYFVSLPAALKFLTNFGGANIQALITADEYFSFALAYIGGFAVLFQLPLIILFINRIHPLTPSKMMGAQRYIVVGSFIVAAILTPTPDPFNQLIMALPIVLLYQVSVILVWLINRGRHLPATNNAQTQVVAPVHKTTYDLDSKEVMPQIKQPNQKRPIMDIMPLRSRDEQLLDIGYNRAQRPVVSSPSSIIDMVVG